MNWVCQHAPVGFRCHGQSGGVYVKLNDSAWQDPSGKIWHAPSDSELTFREAIQYCQELGATLPSARDVKKLALDLRSSNGIMPLLFKLNFCDQDASLAWTSQPTSASLPCSADAYHYGFLSGGDDVYGDFFYLWDLKTGAVSGSTHMSHWSHAVCIDRR